MVVRSCGAVLSLFLSYTTKEMKKVLPVAFREYDVLLSLVFKRLLGDLAETPLNKNPYLTTTLKI